MSPLTPESDGELAGGPLPEPVDFMQSSEELSTLKMGRVLAVR